MTSSLAPLAAVALGGLIGSASRTAIALWLGVEGFPTAILIVNLVGSFALGLYLAMRQQVVTRSTSLHFWAIGMLGSFTTFSTFGVDVVRLIDTGQVLNAGLYLLASLLGGLILAFIGGRFGRLVT